MVTAHGLTQPVHMLRGVRQGNPESPLLYALLLEPLLRAQGHRLRPPGGAEQSLIQAYIDDLLVVAHTLQHFVEGVEALAACLGMMGMELNPRKCAMATTEGVPALQLRLCPHLENPWHWVPAADTVPYLGLQLQPDEEFPLQRKHRLRLAAVHHWCLNTLAQPTVVQDVILAILGGLTQYVAPFIANDSDTARHLDHISVQVAKDRVRYAFDASRDILQDDRSLGLTRVPTQCQQAAVALVCTFVHHRSTSVRAEVTKMFWEIAGAHGICPEVHYPVLELATLAGGDSVHRIRRALAALGLGIYDPIASPHRVGPGPDARHRQQRHASRDRTPTAGPSRDGPPSGPEPPGAVGTGHRAQPRHSPPRRRPPHPGRRPPPPTYRQWPPPTGRLGYSPRARPLLRDSRYGYVPRPAMDHPGDRHHVRPGDRPTRGSGDPTTQHRILRGVLQPGDTPPARALAQITSGKAGYHLGLAMLCLTHWIQRHWPPTGTVPWVWAIPTAHTQVEAGPDTRPNPPPRPQQSLTCGYHAIHRVLNRAGLSPKLACPLPTTDQEVHQIRKLVCEILAAAAEDGKLLLQTARPTTAHASAR